MMTFKDYLSEAITSDEIQRRCGPFLEQAKGRPLYRGYTGAVLNLFKNAREITVRKDRKPRDAHQVVHGLIDAYFQKKFGVRVRSEGLFATGDEHIARRYGDLHYVFPVGEFKFVWGTYKDNPVQDTIQWARDIKLRIEVQTRDKHEASTQEILDQIDWHTTDLVKAIESGAEIALLADKALLVPLHTGLFSKAQTYKEIINGEA